MPIIPLYGHRELRTSLADSFRKGALPASILLHGPRGIGKQRLALSLAELLLCTGDPAPCGKCDSCRYNRELAHPDLHWFFPRPRPKDADASAEEIRDDIRETIAERVEKGGIYPPAVGTEGIFVATVRALTQVAASTPAVGKRKVFVVGDADRMVVQEGADQAANAFLKLLEEPPSDTIIILTSSEPGALLPTIRSRVAAIRVNRLPDAEVREFLADPNFQREVEEKPGDDEAVRVAAGAPGALLSGSGRAKALAAARRIIEAANTRDASKVYATTLAQGSSGARGAFSDVLDSLLIVLNERVRDAVHRADEATALATTRALEAVARAQRQADGNVNPQLITSRLMRELRVTNR